LIQAADGRDHISQAYRYARVVDDFEAEEFEAEDIVERTTWSRTLLA